VATLDEADGAERTVVLDSAADAAAVGLAGPIEVVVADPEPAAAPARGEDAAGALAYVDVAGRSVGFRLAPPPDVDRAVRSAEAHASGGAAELVAPMPGAVLTVHRSAGDAVVAGNPVVTLEAMKMEHVVEAPATGVIAEIAVKPGDQVTRGQRLASLRASEAEASAGALAEAGAASEPGTAGKDAR
jgi:biotin carboxyl carrier protein